MISLSEHDVFIFITQLGLFILAARLFGEIAKRLGQPIIVGEVFAGIFLGPSIFGFFFPEIRAAVFPDSELHSQLLGGVSWLCVLFLLLITGLEIDVRSSIRHGKQNLFTALGGITIPFASIFLISFLLPDSFYPENANRIHVHLMIATALALVSIPVIAKILLDLNILRSNVGLNIITSGVIGDILGWSILGVVIALVEHGAVTPGEILKPILIMIVYFYVALQAGKWINDKILDFIGGKVQDSAAVFAFLFSLALLNGTTAHLLGIHVLFGAFVAGLMVGESDKITPHMREMVQDFVMGVFAPIFFVLIGMQLDLNMKGDWIYILMILAVSSLSKAGGAYIGALAGGLGKKNSFAVSCGLNTPGTMGIIAALIAFEMGLFNEKLFSSIVIVCILSVLFVGILLKWAIKGVRRPLADFFDEEHVFLDIPGNYKKDVIEAIVKSMASRKIIKTPKKVYDAILKREASMSTAIGGGSAFPHARLSSLKKPVLCFFRLASPVDFQSPDDVPVRLIFLELTPDNDEGLHLNLMAQIAKFLINPENRDRLLNCKKESEVHHLLSFDQSI